MKFHETIWNKIQPRDSNHNLDLEEGSPMKRRSFLIGAVALPAWLSCAYSNKGQFVDEEGEISSGSSLGRAYLKAQSLGKPLLVLVVPALPHSPKDKLTEAQEKKQNEAYTARYERGHAFGELLNYGAKEQLWPLALVEVICALPQEIEVLTGSNVGSPLMVLIETSSTRAVPVPLDGKLPALFDDMIGSRFESYEEQLKAEDQLITERITLLAKLIKEAVAPTQKSIESRATQTRKALPEESKTLSAKIEKGLAVEEADLIASLIAEESTKKEAFLDLLLEVVKARLCKPPIDGSRWARTSGCGTTYEDPPKPKVKKTINADGSESTEYEFESFTVVGCGMGHTPKRSQRFLSFFTEEGEV
jgi:hypothetical protein